MQVYYFLTGSIIFCHYFLKKSFSLSEDAPTPAWLKGVAPEWKKVGSLVGTEGGGRQPGDWHRLAGCGAVKISKFFSLGQNPKQF